MDVSGKVVMVTGAGSGLGASVARAVTARGGKAVIIDINAEAGQAMADILGGTFVKTDVTSEIDGNTAVAIALEQGPVAGIVNCAGIAPGAKVVGRDGPHDLEIFAKTININLVGSFNMSRLAAEAMAANEPNDDGERGVIINTASIAAYDGQIGQAAYAASKGGVASLTLPMARELARSGIRVMAIAPGIFGTPMLLGLPQEVQDSLGGTVPFPPRLGKPSEFADFAMHIFDNPMLNGEVVRLDGALRMAPK
jgi:NAD(P)-dependent dehydrogenase (short-subunit alcohol dehydrogenase family)